MLPTNPHVKPQQIPKSLSRTLKPPALYAHTPCTVRSYTLYCTLIHPALYAHTPCTVRSYTLYCTLKHPVPYAHTPCTVHSNPLYCMQHQHTVKSDLHLWHCRPTPLSGQTYTSGTADLHLRQVRPTPLSMLTQKGTRSSDDKRA